ncbi:hypothetical protein CVS47_02578 [Microbacterium lemovicicum]|uniref:DUF559 domain-containing protein n=1 Tax=Microbacterium lemovicicum TaxID=1072463 RepID=A0A3Q9IZT2_9MICO|nr:DUF559 domain-containing protein [Microbacterium lemovicicum]AZS37928.1 hypothetical protein CVS47_02578 [Microbacterium lemovicicum]
MEKIQDAAHSVGGVIRVQALRRRGFSRREVERALAAGRIERVRNGWVATRSADPLLVSAARAGVVLSCVTRAQRLGLWVLDGADIHVAAPPHSGHATWRGATVHWSVPPVPRHPAQLEDTAENALCLVAACQPFESALVVFESALRTGVVARESLRRLRLPASARAVLDEADDYADSGLETLVVPRLRWLGLPLRRQILIAGHRVDLLIGDRLVLQIDGGHHVGAQRDSDMAHDAQLTLLGYHVIRVGYVAVVERWHEVQDVIMRAVAQNLHKVRS